MDIPLSPNPYTTLGVAKDATLAAIRTAHRKLVLSCHPDKVLDESDKKIKAEQFHQVREAYEILSDDVKRQEYDQKARLAGMRAEMMEDRGPTRRSAEHTSPRAPPYSPVYEMRGGRRVEERVPNYARTYQDETFVPRYTDSRPVNRPQDDFYREPVARKTSGRGPDDKRRSRDADIEYERKMKEAREQKDRKRAKDRKRDVEAKSRNKFSFVDDDGSDSETDSRYHDGRRRSVTPPRRRYEETRRPVREESRRSSKRDEHGIDDATENNIRKAQEHMMSRHREALREVDVDSRSKPSRPRATSNLDRMVNTPAPPPPPRPADGRRRSSDRERSDKERSDREKERRRRATSPVRTPSGKKEKNIEIVDSPSSRKPAMGSYSSDPRGLKGMADPPRREPQRSATAQVPPQQVFQKPAMRRAETLPASQMRGNTYAPPRSSKLRTNKATTDSSSDSSETESDDSDATPEIRPRGVQRHTSYKVSGGDTAYVEEPETYSREPSPRSRRSTDRPPMAARGSSTRTPPTRSGAFVDSSDRPSIRRSETARIPQLNTHGSSRGKKGSLFGEVIDEYSSPDDSHGRGAPRSPRGSPLEPRGYERRGSRDVDHDIDPYKYKSSHSRPSYQRTDSVRV